MAAAVVGGTRIGGSGSGSGGSSGSSGRQPTAPVIAIESNI